MTTTEAYRPPETSGAPARARFADAGEAARSVLGRAAAASPALTQREWRVLAAVLQLTTSYARLSDRVYKAQLAAAAGDLEDKALQRSLRSLAERHLITWQPSSTKGRPSTVGVVPPVRGVEPGPPKLAFGGAEADPPNPVVGGAGSDPPTTVVRGVDPGSLRGVGADPPPRKYQGETSSCAAPDAPDEQEEEIRESDLRPAAGVVQAIRERHPVARILMTDLGPLRAAIAGALERGCHGDALAAAMSRKVAEAATVGLLVALARDADPSDYPLPSPATSPSPASPRDVALRELGERDPGRLARLLSDAEYDARDGHRVPDLDTAPPQLRERILEAAYSRLVALQREAPAS